MLKPTTEVFETELRIAIRQRDARLAIFPQQVRKYRTSAYRSDTGVSTERTADDPENHNQEFIATVLPMLANATPRLRTESRRGGEHNKTAQIMKYGLESWMDWCDFLPWLSEAAIDFLFNWNAASISQQERRPLRHNGVSIPQALPKVERIPQERFLMDPAAMNTRDVEWTAMLWTSQHDDLLEQARTEMQEDPDSGWNIGAIGKLGGTKRVNDLRDRKSKVELQDLDRDEVVLYDVWIKNWVEDGDDNPNHNGGIVTFAVTNYSGGDAGVSLMIVRNCVPYFGPKTGPFVVSGAYYVPSEAYPLGPLTGVDPQVKMLNRVSRAVNRGIENYKRVILTDSDSGLDENDINKPDAFVIPIPGFQKDMLFESELGGVTAQALAQLNLLRERLARNSGHDDAQRGRAPSDTTATAVEVAAGASASRMSYIENRWHQHVVRVLDAVKFFLHSDSRSVFPLGVNAERELGMVEPWYNPPSGEAAEQYSADDVKITIEAGSMRQVYDAVEQRRVLQAIEIIQIVVALYIEVVGQIDGPGLLAKVGDVLNIPDMNQLVNWKGLDALIAANAEAQQNAQQRDQGEDRRRTNGPGDRGQSTQPRRRQAVTERTGERRSAVA